MPIGTRYRRQPFSLSASQASNSLEERFTSSLFSDYASLLPSVLHAGIVLLTAVADPKVFTNVATSAKETAQAAAYLVLAQSDGKANVAVIK